MDKKTLNLIIPIASVVIFFIWGWLEGKYQHSWIIFLVAGGAMAVVANMDKNNKVEETKPEKKDENE